MGVGGTFGQQHFQKGLLHDVPRFPARKECGVLDFKLTIDVCISSSPALLCEIPPFVWSVLELLGSSISKKDCCMMYLVSLQEKNAVCLYTTYILPSGELYATYHLLGEPETTIDFVEDSGASAMDLSLEFQWICDVRDH